ncbi:SLOG family protein [Intestinimonas massiliensis]|uniref:SLOG family protein n=1 Tax=Intestinimonas massiliensis (ex Afouda et al. 2020) TaxID=1673721 RepID=A0AAW5JPJ8_9FIRM|nr:SLOG family protein [Intestinimonas massiliensis (ex Afouda et al. 2020)]MCQ4770305.1 SLOG family protein [Intestinimonas massiliensis (ex Afouda et al. 2020)]
MLPWVKKRLEKVIEESIQTGYLYFGAGGALGFDTLAANTVIKLRAKHPDIKLILVLPCKTQTRGWKQSDIEEYERIIKAADKVVYTSENYFSGCMHKRNRHLVNNSSLCICYLTEDNGGTFYTVNYAKQNGLSIVNIAG